MSWLLLAALGMLWAAFLNPSKKASPAESVRTFERDMIRLSGGDTGGGRGIVTPRKGTVVGDQARAAAARARARRRRVLGVLVEAAVITFLIGLAPPLRPFWYATAGLLAMLAGYLWLIMSTRERRAAERRGSAFGTPSRRSGVRPLVPDEDDEDDPIVVIRTAGSLAR